MSSPKSPELHDAPLDAAGLHDALAEVAENSLFAFCDASAPDQLAAWVDTSDPDCAGGPAGPWLTGRVAFTGPCDGHIEIALPAPLARDLCTAFAGFEDAADADEAAVRDFVGELVNTVCGLWLTRGSRERLFDLHPPVVAETTGMAMAAVAGIDGAAADAAYATVNDVPVVMRLSVARRGC
jgi:hypothetical protein